MQSSFSDLEYAAKKKLTWRDRFLAGIHVPTSWAELETEIEPFYPKGEGRGQASGQALMEVQGRLLGVRRRFRELGC